MKTEFERYLKMIGISELFYERSLWVLKRLSEIMGEEILDIFVSDYFESGGKRNYSDLLLITQQRIVEVKQFLTSDNYFFNNVRGIPISGIELKANEYNFEKATEKSRLFITVHWGSAELSVPMKAAQGNCDNLCRIFKKYFLSPVVES